jgi:hypothetical protein
MSLSQRLSKLKIPLLHWLSQESAGCIFLTVDKERPGSGQAADKEMIRNSSLKEKRRCENNGIDIQVCLIKANVNLISI